MKKASNNLTYLIDKGSATWVFVAAGTENLDDNSEEKRLKELGVASNPRQSTYPVNENLDLFHLWTGAPIVNYREGFVLQQSRTFYKLPQQCLSYASSMKKPGVSWHKRLDPIVTSNECSEPFGMTYVCSFTTQPSFSVRGLCKDSVMDTQYKFADHKPDPEFLYGGIGKDDYRSFVGPKGWIIARNKTDKRWRMSHYHYTDLTLTMLDHDALPVGRHTWRVENNVCNEGQTSTEVLQISGCTEGQFTCDDGKCVDISKRCNNIEVCIQIF